ncbi:dual specificity protein phosphatase 5 [Athene cunicularia]|uniref:dual specificity protein phosphatase 5 n=1 Tax=Athene cunicularia TaxID=194338 RepID=UPI000EF65B73|nr:dual specificity protein phosphatase 5 [Athene cunicularia]
MLCYVVAHIAYADVQAASPLFLFPTTAVRHCLPSCVLSQADPHVQMVQVECVEEMTEPGVSEAHSFREFQFTEEMNIHQAVDLGPGGYETFNSQYPECCVDGKLLSPERTEAERNLTSHCEKQSANHKPAYDQGGPVEILPFLYLGSAYHASKCEFLANLHITALLNVSRKSSESFKDQYCYKWIPVEDSHTADISSHFQEAIDFIDYVRRTGGKILVHCEAGISRSPTICMAYLMKTKKLCLEEAFDYIKQRRSLISPNFGFMGQLLQYESEILSSTPSPPVASCKREAASFFAEELTLGKNFEGSCFAFPTSVLSSVPIHSPVHQLKLSPMTASSSC